MPRIPSRLLLVTLGLLLLGAIGVAPSRALTLAQSHFSANAEGWTNVMLPYPSAIPATVLNTYTPQWTSSLGGYIQLTDPDGSGSSGDAQYWSAPPAFLGTKTTAYGGELSFSLADAGSGFGGFAQEDILLIGAGITLVRTLPFAPGATFAQYTIPMVETGWKRGGIAGPNATEAEFRSVLAFVDHLYVRAEYQLGPDTQYLDEVLLTSGTVDVPRPSAPGFALSAPLPNPSFGAIRLQLSLPRGAEGEVAVYDAAGRRVAVLGRGSWPAGEHALEWDGLDRDGAAAGAGLYWVRAEFEGMRSARPIVRTR